ncbi:potassium channel family protein [Nocardioides euryhalodurans]|uniref:Two pore domain potassium channel family protein n=1 Tax=Nocardioides euryhalodurans TaxID=2518370 RepID=A0A4P7GHU3_9ACTN|nr:potassium channel family protein [Nocardioides euryhalodurans]QBR91249.1 two pore domain potassium channel family protein [Nocardioides euryhalodurans]
MTAKETRRRRLRLLAIPLAVLVLYFVLPVDPDEAPLGVLTGLMVSGGALAAVVRVIALEARGSERRLSGWHLVVVLEIALVAFSFAYFLIETRDPDQFSGLATRLDALYFATATVATVGYGDVHATGQVARGFVTLNMVFNLVFIAAVVNLAKERLSERRHHAQGGGGGTPQDQAGP